MYRFRLFAARHSRSFERLYAVLETSMVALHPLFRRIGYGRVEKVVAPVEKLTKSLLFDCRMCGQCVLSSTGMSCPMNCPKTLRNGPCGGVRPGGYCEVKPEMRCVWVEAWNGAARMKGRDKIGTVLPPVDNTLKGSSAWLRASREKAETRNEATGDARRTTIARAFPGARRSEPTAAPLASEPASARDPRR
ncbi:methylenetetrahydrofolate reductase C-terminal domain-containing protein [Marinibacterium profundimaris]|uniref:Methylene-tetrahydrofolate reductase C-terminal-like domain-containing protein n=1 Tax=Marinibacterium profundimaris TaxID=1679460 RepID=A0A225NR89_9RHOB|nr:methylenetetrahydrofolate reductase C-terminal domain-containing protein [Marinibacterium profundimaris]OWU75607.1 hypothetical protein ATO3_05120 [Marinibacterium profundimaris]